MSKDQGLGCKNHKRWHSRIARQVLVQCRYNTLFVNPTKKKWMKTRHSPFKGRGLRQWASYKVQPCQDAITIVACKLPHKRISCDCWEEEEHGENDTVVGIMSCDSSTDVAISSQSRSNIWGHNWIWIQNTYPDKSMQTIMVPDVGINSFKAWNVGHPKLLRSKPEKLVVESQLVRQTVRSYGIWSGSARFEGKYTYVPKAWFAKETENRIITMR